MMTTMMVLIVPKMNARTVGSRKKHLLLIIIIITDVVVVAAAAAGTAAGAAVNYKLANYYQWCRCYCCYYSSEIDDIILGIVIEMKKGNT